MIDTIFYFVRDFDTYKQKLDNNEILAKTIVFVEDQKAIYKNGVRYGSMSTTDIRNEIANIINGDQIILNIISLIYDDAWIRTWLDLVDRTITAEQKRLSDLINDLDADIQDKVEDLLRDSTWLRNNVNQNELFLQSMKWDNGIQAYLLEVGIWTNLDDNIVTLLSTLRQSVEDIEQLVGSTTEYPDGKIDALLSALNLQVDPLTHEATSEISTIYTELNKAKQVIEWLYSGLKSSSSSNNTFNDLVSAANSNSYGAISDIRTAITKLTNGGYVSDASLTTLIQGYINGLLTTAGVITEAGSLGLAFSILFARSSDPTSQIEGWSQLMTNVDVNDGVFVTKTGLVNEIENNINGIKTVLSSAGVVTTATEGYANSEIYSTIHDEVETQISSSGVITTAQLNDTSSAIYSKLNETYSIIATSVLKDANTNKITSDIVLSADHVSIDADVISAPVNSMLTGGNASFYGNVQAKQFIAGLTGNLLIITNGSLIKFMNGSTPVGYFAIEGNGLQLYIYDGSNWKKIDFSNWANQNGSIPDSYSFVSKYNLSSSTITDATTSLSGTGMQLTDFTAVNTWLNITTGDGKIYTANDGSTTYTGDLYEISTRGVWQKLNQRVNPQWYNVAYYPAFIITKYSVTDGVIDTNATKSVAYSNYIVDTYSTDADGELTNVTRTSGFLQFTIELSIGFISKLHYTGYYDQNNNGTPSSTLSNYPMCSKCTDWQSSNWESVSSHFSQLETSFVDTFTSNINLENNN